MKEIIIPPRHAELTSKAPNPTELQDEWSIIVDEESARTVSLRGPIISGIATLVIGVGGFLVWAYFTPVAQASAATGKVIAESYTKTVTHLEGGTLKEIVVREGQRVRVGDLLATLEITRSRSVELQARQQLFINKVKMARLIAERDERKSFSFAGEVPQGMSSEAASQLVETEERLFKERQNQYIDLVASAQSQVEQFEILYLSYQAKKNAQEEQLAYLQKDDDLLTSLEKRKLATRPQLNEKRIQLWEMKSRVAESEAAMGQNRQQLAQAKLTLSNLRTEHLRSISEELQQVHTDIARGQQEIVSAADVVEKAAIRSPQDGTVSNIKVVTPGSAVTGGSPIMDIVPSNQPLVIEAKARAMDIDSIHLDAPAEIHLASFGADEAFPLKGKVSYVAADSVTDPTTGETTYAIRVKLDNGELAKQPNLFLYPGMTAEIYVVNGQRTALTYLISPLTKSFTRAFREQ
jgi:HlyD family secretion protein